MKRLAPFLLLISIVISACQVEPASPKSTGAAPVGEGPAKQKPPEPTLTPAPVTSDAPLTDGVLAVAGREDKNWLTALDPVTGGRIEKAEPIFLGQSYAYAYAPDGRGLALITFEWAVTLHLVDLPTWTDTRVELPFERPYYCCSLRYSRDGSRLAVTSGEDQPKIYIVDLDTLTLTASGQADSTVLAMQFTQDGRGLMVYGRLRRTIEEIYDDPVAALYDTGDLSLVWKASLSGIKEGLYPKDPKAGDPHLPGAADMYQSGLAFAPDRDALYIAHSTAPRLTTIDFSAQEITTVEIARETTWLDRLMYRTARPAHAKVMDGTFKQAVLSPDGDRLYVMGMVNEYKRLENGEFELVQTPLNLQSVRVRDGALLAEITPEFGGFSGWFDLSIAADGSTLMLMDAGNDRPNTQVFDPETLRLVEAVPGLEVYPGGTLNGEPLLLGFRYGRDGQAHQMAAFTTAPFEQLGLWEAEQDVSWLRPRP